MLDDVVAALAGAERIDRVVIASRDAAARDEAARLGVEFLDQTALQLGYNRAVEYAQAALADAEALLVVPADVPLLTPDAVDLVVATAPDGPAIVVAPAHNGGTNGLFLRPPGVIRPQFGPSSARAHAQAAAAAGEAGVPYRLAQIDVWAYDLDTPADLRLLGEVLPQLPEEIAREHAGVVCGTRGRGSGGDLRVVGLWAFLSSACAGQAVALLPICTFRHARESGNSHPTRDAVWIPAFAGMTEMGVLRRSPCAGTGSQGGERSGRGGVSRRRRRRRGIELFEEGLGFAQETLELGVGGRIFLRRCDWTHFLCRLGRNAR